jgi:hypothetical protein
MIARMPHPLRRIKKTFVNCNKKRFHSGIQGGGVRRFVTSKMTSAKGELEPDDDVGLGSKCHNDATQMLFVCDQSTVDEFQYLLSVRDECTYTAPLTFTIPMQEQCFRE